MSMGGVTTFRNIFHSQKRQRRIVLFAVQLCTIQVHYSTIFLPVGFCTPALERTRSGRDALKTKPRIIGQKSRKSVCYFYLLVSHVTERRCSPVSVSSVECRQTSSGMESLTGFPPSALPADQWDESEALINPGFGQVDAFPPPSGCLSQCSTLTAALLCFLSDEKIDAALLFVQLNMKLKQAWNCTKVTKKTQTAPLRLTNQHSASCLFAHCANSCLERQFVALACLTCVNCFYSGVCHSQVIRQTAAQPEMRNSSLNKNYKKKIQLKPQTVLILTQFLHKNL